MSAKSDVAAWIGNGMGAILTAVQTNETFQLISLILTIVATSITIIVKLTPLIARFFHWLRNSLKDGVIDEEEAKEGLKIADDVKESVDEISKTLENHKQEEK